MFVSFALPWKPGKNALEIPGSEGSDTGFSGKCTGPRGKRYRALGEMIPGFGGNFFAIFPANKAVF